MTRDEAIAFRKLIESSVATLDDKTVSYCAIALPRMQYDGALIKSGTRITWNGTIKRAAVDLFDREENNPEKAPVLWEDIEYQNGIRVIPETITAGQSFSKGELGIWKGEIYESLILNNVWTPEQYLAGWEKKE